MHKYVCATCVPSVCSRQERAFNLFELELQMVVNHPMGPRSQMWFFTRAFHCQAIFPTPEPLTLFVDLPQWPQCLFWTLSTLVICKESQWAYSDKLWRVWHGDKGSSCCASNKMKLNKILFSNGTSVILLAVKLSPETKDATPSWQSKKGIRVHTLSKIHMLSLTALYSNYILSFVRITNYIRRHVA